MARRRTRLRFIIAPSSNGAWYVTIDFGNGNTFAGANGYNSWESAMASVRSICANAQYAEVALRDRRGKIRVLREAAMIDTGAVRYP